MMPPASATAPAMSSGRRMLGCRSDTADRRQRRAEVVGDDAADRAQHREHVGDRRDQAGAEPLQIVAGHGHGRAQLRPPAALGAGDAHRSRALVSVVDRTAPHRLGAGGTHHGALLPDIDGAAADRLGALGAGDGTALTGGLEILHGGLGGFTDAVAALLASHEDRRAHVVAPFKAVVAFAPAEHAASGDVERATAALPPQRIERSFEPACDDGRALAAPEVTC